MMNKKSMFIAAFLTLYGISSVYAGNEAGSGGINGRVVDAQSQILPGASIFVRELKIGVISDNNGYFTLPKLAPGKYTLEISYLGYEPFSIVVNVSGDKMIERNVVLKENNGIDLPEVQIKGVFTDQQRALNVQKNKMGVANIISADQVGKFPDSNIGDALKRINGINVQYDQGEARFGQVRGTSADYTSVSVNGNRLPSAEGGTRNVQLDLVPADMVQTIEVSKVVTSDMDGDAIGGAINLVTKNSPFRRVFNATAGAGYNVFGDTPQLNFGLTYGDRFFNDKFGVMVSGSYQNSPFGSDNVEFEYQEKDGEIQLKEAQVRQYKIRRERQSYSLGADYKFNPSNRISFKGIYNRRNDWENRYRISYKKLNSSPSKQSIVMQTKGGSDDERNARLERQQTMDFTLDGEHTVGRLMIDWAGSYAHAAEDRPNERYFAVALKGKNAEDYFNHLSFADAGGKFPYAEQSIPSYSDPQNKWEVSELSNSVQNISEDEWKFRLNFKLPLMKGIYANTLKFGAKFTYKTKDREKSKINYMDAYEEQAGDNWKQHLSSQIRSGFMPGNQYPLHSDFIDKHYLGSLPLGSWDGQEDLYETSGNYHAKERVSSAYIRFDQQFGKKADLVIGLRMENTDLAYSGFNYAADEDEKETVVPTGKFKNNYTNWLPSVLFKYNANKDCKLRASFTETLARPKYSDLVPCVNYNVQDEEASLGNPYLKPTVSYNFDLNGEYYFRSVGLVSLGLFYKNIYDVIVDEVWKGQDNEIPVTLGQEYLIDKPVNAYDADLFGVEFAYQRDFGFIAPALKCFGFYGTYTYTHSTTKNLKFEHRTVEEGEKIKMAGSPEHTANASLYFEKKGLDVRLSYNFASSFVDEMGTVAALDRYYDKTHYLDLNMSYTFGKRFKTTVFADVTNLLNQPLRYYQGEKDRTMQVEYYGVKANAGVKISF